MPSIIDRGRCEPRPFVLRLRRVGVPTEHAGECTIGSLPMRTVLLLIIIVSGVIVIGAIILVGAGVLILAEGVVVIVAVAGFIAGVALAIRDALKPAPAACALLTRTVLPDTCSGACPVGSACTATSTRGYFFGAFGQQALTCACTPVAGAGGGGTGGTGGGGTGGGTGGGGGDNDDDDDDDGG